MTIPKKKPGQNKGGRGNRTPIAKRLQQNNPSGRDIPDTKILAQGVSPIALSDDGDPTTVALPPHPLNFSEWDKEGWRVVTETVPWAFRQDYIVAVTCARQWGRIQKWQEKLDSLLEKEHATAKEAAKNKGCDVKLLDGDVYRSNQAMELQRMIDNTEAKLVSNMKGFGGTSVSLASLAELRASFVKIQNETPATKKDFKKIPPKKRKYKDD